MNTIIKNNKEYKLIGIWDTDGYDSKGKKFTISHISKDEELNEYFINKFKTVNIILKETSYYQNYEEKKDCLLCDTKKITNGKYQYRKFIWEDGMEHYIEKHNFIPPEIFQDLIFFFKLDTKITLKSKIIDLTYIKINKNQLMILDALLKHGGYTKKYIDLQNKEITRYSEHAGLLDFNMNILEKIVVAGNTTRVDKGDNEIFLPLDIKDYQEYEYIFHTHPPTPKPGGRVLGGILYEFPSMGDILHFIDSFNSGKVCGSLVVSSEGLYNIRKLKLNHDKIDIDEDALFKEFTKNFMKIQDNYITKYGTNFNSTKFYKKIAQDKGAINEINKILNKYELNIDYYPRIKHKNNWILNIVYLPIY